MPDQIRKIAKVFYIDDEPRNISLVELTCPEEWELYTFNSAADALTSIVKLDPDVVISDQKMPQMTGLQFLEICTNLHPKSVRIVVTGQTADNVLIELIQKAKIFDYILKPWDGKFFVERVQKAILYSLARSEKLELLSELESVNILLRNQQSELFEANKREQKLRELYEGWIPYPLVKALKKGNVEFPFNANICCIVFDIKNWRVAGYLKQFLTWALVCQGLRAGVGIYANQAL